MAAAQGQLHQPSDRSDLLTTHEKVLRAFWLPDRCGTCTRVPGRLSSPRTSWQVLEIVYTAPGGTEYRQRRAQQAKRDHKQDADQRLGPDPTKALANARMTSTVVQMPLPIER